MGVQLHVTHKTPNTEEKPPPPGDPMTLDKMKAERGTLSPAACPGG